MALYSAITGKGNLCLQPSSAFYSGYSAHVVVMQEREDDIMQDIIEGLNAIRRWSHALSRGSVKVNVSRI